MKVHFEPLKTLHTDFLLSQYSTSFMDIIKLLKNMFIKPNIYDMGFYPKIKGLPFTELQLPGSSCSVFHSSGCTRQSLLTIVCCCCPHRGSLCSMSHCKLQLQAQFLHPAVTTYFVPDYLLSFWLGRVSEVQLVIMPFVPRVIIFLKAFILFSIILHPKNCWNTRV